MKTRVLRSLNCEGSVLLATMMAGVIMGIVLVSYLSLVRHQNATVARSQAWNGAMSSAEAGVEEAMAQLTSIPLTTNINRSANGWTLKSGSYYIPATRELANGYYTVSFTDVPQLVITAKGTNYDKALNAYVGRSVEVRTTNAPVFSVALAALLNIKMNGHNVATDSYISTSNAFSTGGLYDPLKARQNGDVASVGGVIDVGSSSVKGDVLTGPTGSYSVNNNGTLTGTWQNDFNAVYPDVKPPTNYYSYTSLPLQNVTLASPVGGASGSATYSYAFNSITNRYLINGGDLTKPVYVGPGADISFYITGDVSLNDNIYIAQASGGKPAGKLTIYMASANFKIKDFVNNATPSQLAYYGLPINTSFKFTGGAAYTGTIYAPQADMQMNGGCNICGACVVKSADLNGNALFHYDESLGSLGPTVYKAAAWKEL